MIIPYIQGSDAGIGINTISLTPLAKGVNFDSLSSAPGGTGSNIRYKLSLVTSRADLAEQLEVNASLSMSFGVSGANAKVRFFREQRLHSYSSHLLLQVQIKNAFEQLVSPRLTDEAVDLLDDQVRFFERFGDYYVRGFTSGGELLALITYEIQSEYERQQFNARLQASGGFGTWSSSVDFEKISLAFSETINSQVLVQIIGGDPNLGIPTSIPELIQRAKQFPQEAATNGSIFTIQLSEYQILNLPVSNPYETSVQKNNFIFAAGIRSQAWDLITNIDYVKNNREEFDDFL